MEITGAIKLGADIVYIPEFKKRLENARAKFERDVFWPREMKDGSSPEHLAGIFAAKEAALKAFGLAAGDWKLVEIKKLNSGKPIITFRGDPKKSFSAEVSISHAGDYAIAVVAAIAI